MLSSLFGDLRLRRGAKSETDSSDQAVDHFAATAIMDKLATESDASPETMVDERVRDLVIAGSAAQAIRDHFMTSRADMGRASRQICLIDPTAVWASSVLEAIAATSGRTVEKLNLREEGTLRTLAMIERTVLERRNEDTLRIYHADVRAPGSSHAAISNALMEHSHMTAVIVGAMGPNAVDDLLISLYSAVQRPNWRCPTLLFILPPNAVWISNKISMIDWPHRLRVQSVNESLNSASDVWHSLLSMWNRVKNVPVLKPSPTRLGPAPFGELGDFPIKLMNLEPSPALTVTPSVRHKACTLTATIAQAALHSLQGLEGLRGCAVVDAHSGTILARLPADNPAFHVDLAAAAAAQVLRAYRKAAQDLGASEDVTEIITRVGEQHHVLKTLARHRGHFIFALLRASDSDLAVASRQLQAAEQGLMA